MKQPLLLLLINVFLCLSAFSVDGNYAFWVQFSDKEGTPYSLEDPAAYLSEKAILRRAKQHISTDSTDLPVNRHYVDAVLEKGAKLHTQSRWLNGITVFVDDETVIDDIALLPFVVQIEKTFVASAIRKAKTAREYPQARSTAANDGYGNAFTQISMLQGDRLHSAGFRGSGMTIAVLDAGFLNVDDNSAFSSLWNNGQIVGTKDFVNSDSDIFNENYHGGTVLSVMGAQQTDLFMGTAPDADFWLIRTENHDTEHLIETDNLVAAMEFADSAGVDIINASLGYYHFDDETMNFKHSDLDGKTTRASRAASLCAGKGIVFVCSAGNQGNKEWQLITVPADASDILAVGSMDEQLEHSPFSGTGYTADKRIKPDVCALGSLTTVVNQNNELATPNGTSYSAPLIAGLAACLWQALPQLTATQLMNVIRKAASSYNNPNPETGYGVPDFYAAYLEQTGTKTDVSIQPDKIKIYPNPAKDSLTIELDSSLPKEGITYTLTNLQHQTQQSGQLQNGEEIITLDSLSQGIYILLIKQNRETVFQEKIIKE